MVRSRRLGVLRNVSEFMSQQLMAAMALWVVLSAREQQVIASRVSKRIYCARRFRRGLIDMNTHVAEVFPKSGLKPRASCGIQRNSGGTKNIRDSNLRALENVFWPRNVRLLHRPASGLRRFQEQIDSAIKCASAHILVRRRGFALSKV